jgi:hypothetical protein
MATCANITLEKIRAELDFGGELVFATPDIESFSVQRSRQQLAATFNASISVPADVIFPAGQDVTIKAGTLGNLKTLFTGKVLSIDVSPTYEDATSYVVNLSGQDVFHELEGHTFSRRQRTRGQSNFAAITGIASRNPQKGVSYEKRIGNGGSHRLRNPTPNIREHPKLVKTDRATWDPFKTAKGPQGADTAGTTELEVIDIIPKSIALSPGISARFELQGTTYSSGDTWSVSDDNLATIVDQEDGTAVVTPKASGQFEVIFSKATGEINLFVGKASVVAIPIHNHRSLGEGGPAFAVYGSE